MIGDSQLVSIIPEVDKLVSGEVPKGYFLMLTGPPSIGKGIFAVQYAYQGVLQDESAVYIVTDAPPSDVRKIMQRFGWDTTEHEQEEIFRFIDGYSWRSGGPFEEKYYISDPANLTDVMIEVDRALKGLKPPVRVIFDSFSSIAWMSSTSTAIRFLQGLDGKIKKNDYNGIYTVEEGMHDSMTMATLRAQTDGIFEMKLEEKEDGLCRYFRIFSIRGLPCSTRWIPWTITNKGIEFK